MNHIIYSVDTLLKWGSARFDERASLAIRDTAKRMYDAGMRHYTLSDVHGIARGGTE